ncbi:sulfite exporter TauE/SafE family protein [Pseudothauera rhizosphaerae]|uniref:Probable membrane transporter protein n=1 Tax=Pseudothauera rhizosphaerae TaxID=2565932 RepID=A0A4S4AUE8_9RHOO|nr:sulfite exporter TauE/SafE family protein [Pseudothauera rhizosphaerae]THF63518.1 sulfite exporter TauE/SafE family protein [Pseudothauera rhizosphaerae]
MEPTAIIVLGALAGGFVTGLAGFGTGLTALGFWLHAVEPVVAAALVVICSVAGQLQSLRTARVRRTLNWPRTWPFLLGGLAGMPLGVAALRAVDPGALKILLGLLLVGYGSITLGLRRMPTVAWGGKAADALVCLPATLLGAYGGIRLYGRVNDRQFRRYLVLWLLLASGIVLVISNLR